MQWVVIDHIHAPNLVSYARDRGLSSPHNPADLLPRVAAEHLSQRLLDFWIETDRCTSKAFLIVDTLPHLRPQYAFRHGHSVDAWSVPDATLFAFDFANIHESIIAHEIAHLWIDLVEDCEDYRSPVDWLDTARAQQILFIQSFVLDRKVNQVVRERGFDLSIFAEHSRQAISNFTKATLLGHCPPTRPEAVMNALMIASALLEQEDGLHSKEASETHAPVLCYDGSMASALRLLRDAVPEIYDLAERFVAAVQKHGTDNREQIRHAIDECLIIAFEFTGDPLNLETELHEDAPNETYQLDKMPDFLPGWPVRAKIEANKIRAKLRVGNNAPHRLSQNLSGAMQIEFLHPCGAWTSPVIVPHAPYVPQLSAPHSALPPGLRHLPPAVLNLLPETVRTQQPPKTGMHAMQTGVPPVIPSQVPQLPAIPALPDMSASWFGASSKPPYGRSYMAGVGLWLSEARLQEQLDLREHPYTYANNNPLSFVDPEGTHACATFKGGPCAYAESVGDHGTDLGGIICCDGKKHVCLWTSNYPVGTRPGIHKCNNVHESDHLNDVNCPKSGYCRPPFKAGVNGNKEECKAFVLHLQCFKKEQNKECSKLTGTAKQDCVKHYTWWRCVYCKMMKNTFKCTKAQINKVCGGCK
jgi:hypothetical protein